MNIIKKPVTAVKNVIVKHKTAILAATTVTSLTVVAIQQVGLKQHDDFLKDHDLYDEFYSLDEEI